MINKCPGQDKRNIEAETVKCPKCGYSVELFTDEIKTSCPKCKAVIYREVMPSCIDWCAYAKECVGGEIYEEHRKNKAHILKQKLLQALRQHFGSDTKRITHAQRVMDFAEEILRKEGGGWHIVIPASILHDVGIKPAEEKYASSSGRLQEKEGPAIAEKILLELGCNHKNIKEICMIIAYHHTPGIVDTQNFKIVFDADWLVNFKDEVGTGDKEEISRLIHKIFFTKTARDIAEKLYLT